MEDTIAAISTPIGEGGIAIIRISGARALEIADRVFVSGRGKPSQFPTHTIHFGTIGRNGDLVDQVMLTVMRAPRTYTTEDVVEINCHGGLLTARQVLSHCLQYGARLADPGEFTKRAFLNGRIDLTQAEAVMDLIRAKTERAHSAAVHALEGHLSTKINQLRGRLITILAHIEAHIDFPEEDISPSTREEIEFGLASIAKGLHKIVATANEGRILREGVSVAIVGRPNVGKSSLMNTLLGQERSIVTPVPGTTRDTIDEFANIRGIPIRLTDTAGIRDARGKIEQIGVARSRNALIQSELVLHVFDASRRYSVSDEDLLRQYQPKMAILVVNKIDLPRKLSLPDSLSQSIIVEVSAKSGDGLEKLKDKIEQVVWSGAAGRAEVEVSINERHAKALTLAEKMLTCAMHEMKQGATIEIVAQELRIGLDTMGEVVGKTVSDDILDKVFSMFCIGK